MSVKKLCANAMLAALLFTVYFLFSQILYLEFVTFTVIVYAMNLPKLNSLWVVIGFVSLVWLIYGIGIWSIMYMIIYPLFVIIIRLLRRLLSKSLYFIAIFAFFMGLFIGNLIDLPFLLFSPALTMAYLLIGFKTTLVQGGIAFLVILLLYEPLTVQFNKLIEKGEIYA